MGSRGAGAPSAPPVDPPLVGTVFINVDFKLMKRIISLKEVKYPHTGIAIEDAQNLACFQSHVLYLALALPLAQNLNSITCFHRVVHLTGLFYISGLSLVNMAEVPAVDL